MMLKRVLLGVSLAAFGSALVLPVSAAAPVKTAKVAPVADLIEEADARVVALEESLATNDAYLAAKKTKIPVDAGVLAILSQAIVEHDEKSAWKASAADVREAAKAVAASESYDDAKKGLEAIKAAQAGKSAGATADTDWGKLSKLGLLMNEVNKKNGKLRRAVRSVPADPAEASRDASVLAVLALAAHGDTHEVKKKEDISKWQTMSLDMQAGSTELAASLKAKNGDAAKEAFSKVTRSCADCHAAFRAE